MAASDRIKTDYPGVFYRVVKMLGGKENETEKVYYIVYKKNGKVHEEKVGRQYADNMSPLKASNIRGEILGGRRLSRGVMRKIEREKLEEEKKKLTIGKLWEEYQLLNSSKRSLITDQYNFKNHLGDFIDKKPEDILTIDILRLRKKMENKKIYKPATVKHILVLLRMLINWGGRNGLCPPIDPARLRFDIPRLDNERTEMLNDEQLEAYKAALDQEADQNLAAFFRLALVTGFRKSALMNLRWDDCDFEKRIIWLRGSVAKSGKTNSVPMNDAAFEILNSIQRNTGSEYIFPGKDGGPRREIRRMASRVKKNAGLPDDFRPIHGLRHTFASYLISNGVNAKIVSTALTHSTINQTERYIHLPDKTVREGSQIASGIFSRSDDDSKNSQD